MERSYGGTWRSLVAHLHGVQGVPSSNLGVPTNFFPLINDLVLRARQRCALFGSEFQQLTLTRPSELPRAV